jgi:hypothetical protein
MPAVSSSLLVGREAAIAVGGCVAIVAGSAIAGARLFGERSGR